MGGGRGVERLASGGIREKFHFLELVRAVVSFVTKEADAVGGGVWEPTQSKCDLFQVFLALRPVLISFQIIEVATAAILGFVMY